MKLTMRAKELSKKISLITTAFVLAVSTLTAAVPFVLAQNVDAAPGVVETATGFGVLSDWKTDRAPVSGGSTVSPTSQLVMGVDGDNSDSRAASNAFYGTEGLNAALPANTSSVKATLYLDPAWQTVTAVRAGIWGVTPDPSSYPIIEFSNRNETNAQLPGTARFQAWSSAAGAWTTLNVPINYGASYTFEIVHNPTTGQFEYYVNDVLAHTASAANGPLSRVIFNNFNLGKPGNDYSVKWSQFSVGARETPVTTGLNFVKTGTTTPIAAGSFLNYKGVTLKWGATPDTERYQVRVTNPNGATQMNRHTGTPYFTLNDASRHGHFGTIEGEWGYEVRSKSDVTGVWSNWSTQQVLTFDSVKPVLNLPAGSIVGNAPYTFAITQDEANASRAYVEIQQMVNGKWKKLDGKEIKNTNVLSYTIDPVAIGLQSGVATQIKVNSWDKAGNQVSDTKSVVVDLTAPTGTITYGSLAPINGNVIAYLTTDKPVQAIAGWEAIGSDNLRFKKKFTTNASVVVAFRDFANNPGTAQVSITWIDKTAPVAQITAPAQYVTGTVTVTGEVTDAHPMNSYFTIEGPNGYEVDNKKTNGVTTHSFDWNTAGLENGTYTITFETRDKAGNKDAGSTAVKTVIVDNQKPTFTVAGPSDSTVVPASFTVNGTATDSVSGVAYVEYNIRNLTAGYDSSTTGGAVVQNTNATYDSAAGTWSFDVTGLDSGFYRIAVKAVDNAGQHRARSIDVYVDASGPALTMSAEGRTISGTTDEPDRTITLTIGSFGPFTITPQSSAWSFTLPTTVPAGAYDITAFSDDGFGNPTTIFAQSIVIGTVPAAPPASVGAEGEGVAPTAEGDSTDDDENDTPVLPSANGFAAILGTGTDNGDDTDATDNSGVEGTSTEKNLAAAIDGDNTDGNALGLAWYWWLLIIAGGATGIWWLIAALRGRSAE